MHHTRFINSTSASCHDVMKAVEFSPTASEGMQTFNRRANAHKNTANPHIRIGTTHTLRRQTLAKKKALCTNTHDHSVALRLSASDSHLFYLPSSEKQVCGWKRSRASKQASHLHPRGFWCDDGTQTPKLWKEKTIAKTFCSGLLDSSFKPQNDSIVQGDVCNLESRTVDALAKYRRYIIHFCNIPTRYSRNI